MIVQYPLTSTEWTPITSAGKSAIVWLDDDNENGSNRADVRIWHTSGDAPGDAELTKARRVLRPATNADMLSLAPDNDEDIYYARCKNAGDTAILSVDIKGVGVQLGLADVAIQDQTSRLVDRFLTQKISTTMLTAPLALGDRVVNVEAGHGFTTAGGVEYMIEIEEGGHSFQASVIAVNTNALTINSPICHPFTTAATVRRTNPNMAVNGSVTPVIFNIMPPSGVKWDINILSLNMLDDTDMDDGKFGGITMLTNGVVYRTVNGDNNNIFNARNNGCFRRHCDLLEYSPKAPAGQYGLHAVRYFNSQRGDGVARRIGGDAISAFESVVSDDLSGLAKFFCVVRGHVVED